MAGVLLYKLYSQYMGTVKSTSSRTYRLGRRQASAEETRIKLLAAARRLLMSERAPRELSLDRVARRAGVTRLTVYHQFGSKTGLLEAVYDDLARRGRIAENMTGALRQPDAGSCLDAVVKSFVIFWSSDRAAIRRLRAMAALDNQFKGATERDQRRVTAMEAVLQRLAKERGQPFADLHAKAEALAMLTSFEAFDALAGRVADVDKVARTLAALARAALSLP
jgi:AcrR family transcriptional regulator